MENTKHLTTAGEDCILASLECLINSKLYCKTVHHPIITQVATYKILGIQRPFSLKIVDDPHGFVAYPVRLRTLRHRLTFYATKMATCVIIAKFRIKKQLRIL